MILREATKDILIKAIFLFSVFSFGVTQVFAVEIKGKVFDAITKEPLYGTLVSIKNLKVQDFSGIDGSFSFKNIPTGTDTVVVQIIGYIKQEKVIEINQTDNILKLNFLLVQNENVIKEVLINASQDKESDNYARSSEKNSDNVTNVMSAKTMQLSPDITVGNVLQRVSGVTVEKTASGDGRYAIIRGMDKRYNYTLINGIKIPSPDADNRYVPMDIFPSEILERLEVIKSLTPSMEGDAIGGAMNLVLKDASDKFILNANAATGYSQTLFDRSYMQFNTHGINNKSPEEINGPSYAAVPSDFPLQNFDYKKVNALPNLVSGFSTGNRFFNHKLGVLVSGSYQNTNSGSSSLFMTPSAQPNYSPENQPKFDDIQVRTYNLNQQRMAAHAKLDYEFNRKHKISFYTVFAGLDQIRSRHISDTIANINVGEVDQHYESKVTHQDIYNSTLHGEDSIARNFSLDWTAAYSRAWANTPDWGTYKLVGSSFSPALTWKSFTRRWLHNNDQDMSGYVNLTYSPTLFGEKIEFKVGGMDRNKTRDNYYNSYDLSMGNQSFTNINDVQFTVSNPLGTTQDPNNYSIKEAIYAYYGQAKFMIGKKVQLLGGLRTENTSQSYVINESVDIGGQNGTKTYYDLLPSVHVKYILNEKQNIRASYFSSISRPSFFEIVPYTITGEYFSQEGNPYLKHTQADNYDLRYEFFPKPSEQILAGVFYKNIINPIEYAFDRVSISNLDLKPENFGNATNYGFEFVFAKYIKHFGISANYTYTKSQITTDKIVYYNDPVVGNTNKIVSQTRPLQGQANNIANLSLIYKDPKMGLDIHLSAVYTGKLISQVSPDYGLDYWQMPMTRLDFSFEKILSKKMKLSLYGKVNNILNTALVVRLMQPNPYTAPGPFWLPGQDNPNSIVVEKEKYGQSYLLGIRYKF